jgi:heme/copper-type cytochrome/quinol oxidase subunit 3
MATAINLVAPLTQDRRVPLIPSPVIATIILVLTEIMYFSGLISAYNVIRAQLFGVWAPPGEIRLPIAATAFNSVILLISGALMCFAAHSYARPETRKRAPGLFLQAILLGAFFVCFQGYEWVRLIGYGMTLQSSIFASVFFLLIGSHAVHVLIGVMAMLFCYLQMRRGRLSPGGMRAMQVFWLFVVGIWPILYRLVYFG